MKVLKKIVLTAVCLFLIISASASAYYLSVTHGVVLDNNKFLQTNRTIVVFDENDEAVCQVNSTQKQKSVKISEIPIHVQNAFIVAEDKNFYHHNGLDYKGIIRAVIKNIQTRTFKQGASTISQQLIKNTQLSNEKTINRKLKEIKLTRQLEKKYTKSEILEMYLNTIYFGHTCYGIADASNFYFNKEPGTLTIAEAATLAAIIRSPNNYSPFVNPQACLSIRNSVLKQMVENGKITILEKETAEKEALPTEMRSNKNYGCYLEATLKEMQSLPLYSPYQIGKEFRIFTNLDQAAQNYVETLTTDADRSGKSILICDNQTGGIRAWYTTEGDLRRQPGSTIKPLVAYAPAIEENLISLCTPILDEKTDFNGYSPSNYNEQYLGWVSAREALSQSLNIPAVRILNELGVETGVKYLENLKLPILSEDINLSLALGGMTKGFTLRELVGAYTAFARGGTQIQPAFIRKIESDDGTVLYENKSEETRVFSPDTAYLINTILHEATVNGTAKKLKTLPYYLCAKTGTCGSEAGNTDAWSIAYTTQHTIGIWMGNADNSRITVSGGGLPSHYAMLVLKNLYKNTSPTAFEDDPSIVHCQIDKASYEQDHLIRLATPQQPSQYIFTDIFRANNIPTEFSHVFDSPCCEASISLNEKNVSIKVLQTQYYEYSIKRENKGKSVEIFCGKLNSEFIDQNVKQGEIYTYTVQPFFTDDKGEKVYGTASTLPSVYIQERKKVPPHNWWER